MDSVDRYYEECRSGSIIRTNEGFIAVSHMKSATLTVEHIWVKPDKRDVDRESDLLKLAEEYAKERGLRYLEIYLNLHTKLLMNQHRLLIDLGFTPTGSRHDEMVYEKRIGN